MNTTAYDYVCAINTQTILESAVAESLRSLGSDCDYVHLSEPTQAAYTKLVRSLLTPDQFDWLEYWMYECDFGNSNHQITINNTNYTIKNLTLQQYLELTQ